MACTTVTITPEPSAVLTIATVAGATIAVTPVAPASSDVTPVGSSVLTVTQPDQAALKVTPVQPSVLTIGEVCTVSSGTLVVLAASDGPLRTRDGGYFLLNPATNPAGS